MRVLIAMDSFKGNLKSLDVAGIVEKGIRRVYSGAVVEKVAIADGGEGTAEAIVESLKGEYIRVPVCDPVGKMIQAEYGIVNRDTAIIEMAAASGLYLVPEDKRNPLLTSTYGTGELILDAISRGCNKIILGIGGSATNDGGIGMAMALGIRFLDQNGKNIGTGGGSLDRLKRIDTSGIHPAVKATVFQVACDVNNPLCGEKGASRVFGPQKGATPQAVELLDKNLLHYAEVIKTDLAMDIVNMPGAGAAGGLGAGLMVFCGATLSRGIDIVLDTVKIEEKIKNADIVITGEGRVDGQTIFGKVPVGIASRAKKYHKPVFAIAGFIDKGAELVYEHGIDAVMSSMVGPLSLDDAIKESPRLIEEASERLFRIIRAVMPEGNEK
jgi:glycerate 2-kinase